MYYLLDWLVRFLIWCTPEDLVLNWCLSRDKDRYHLEIAVGDIIEEVVVSTSLFLLFSAAFWFFVGSGFIVFILGGI